MRPNALANETPTSVIQFFSLFLYSFRSPSTDDVDCVWKENGWLHDNSETLSDMNSQVDTRLSFTRLEIGTSIGAIHHHESGKVESSHVARAREIASLILWHVSSVIWCLFVHVCGDAHLDFMQEICLIEQDYPQRDRLRRSTKARHRWLSLKMLLYALNLRWWLEWLVDAVKIEEWKNWWI